VRREYPDLRVTELTKLICERWREASPEVKASYDAKSQEGRLLYQQQIALFEETYGKIEKKTRVRLGARQHNNDEDDDDD